MLMYIYTTQLFETDTEKALTVASHKGSVGTQGVGGRVVYSAWGVVGGSDHLHHGHPLDLALGEACSDRNLCVCVWSATSQSV